MISRMKELSKKLAEMAHAHQFRKDRVTPYINHPARVVQILEEQNADDVTISAAWLHDVLEDTDVIGSFFIRLEFRKRYWMSFPS